MKNKKEMKETEIRTSIDLERYGEEDFNGEFSIKEFREKLDMIESRGITHIELYVDYERICQFYYNIREATKEDAIKFQIEKRRTDEAEKERQRNLYEKLKKQFGA